MLMVLYYYVIVCMCLLKKFEVCRIGSSSTNIGQAAHISVMTSVGSSEIRIDKNILLLTFSACHIFFLSFCSSYFSLVSAVV